MPWDERALAPRRAVHVRLSLYESRAPFIWLPRYCIILNPCERRWRHVEDTACAYMLNKSMNELVDKID